MTHLLFELAVFLVIAYFLGCLIGCWLAGLRMASSGPDNLEIISGVGPINGRKLRDLGITTFREIAAWTSEDVARVSEHLRFRGRIEREQWIEQAKLLAAGRKKDFERLYGSGGLIDQAKGRTISGIRTRRPNR